MFERPNRLKISSEAIRIIWISSVRKCKNFHRVNVLRQVLVMLSRNFYFTQNVYSLQKNLFER